MSDSDEEDYQFYGKLLEPYDEDAFPKKKAFSIEDQVATDEQGRRRFHGAFTGGFSAGFFNTVGSLEGWKPAEFKSSRSEKAEKKLQTAHDFMDDEDVGQFGIAPTVVRATSDYSSKIKRKRTANTGGPIPGVPVLHSLLEPAKDTVGIKLLKKMGWKPGQGVGPRLTKSQKQKVARENKRNAGKIYGCEIPESFRPQVQSDTDSSDEEESENITFAPSDYDPYICKLKDNTFGMGYTGLDKRAILSSHISLFDPPEFSMKDHKNNKISVSGQAFGVGAFENEDEDIYARDDMSKYDFELKSAKTKEKKPPQKADKSTGVLEGFVSSTAYYSVESFPPPILPKNFIPKHGVRLSRFEPLPETHRLYNYDRKKAMGRHDLTASERSKILNSEVTTKVSQDSTKKLIATTLNDQKIEEKEQLKVNASKITSKLSNTPLGFFKPFMADPDKQKRYEEYLALVKIGQEKQISETQPASMCNWEREREINEFDQASKMFKPASGLIFDKFVTASIADDHQDPLKPVGKSIYHHGTQEMRDAAEKKMFGTLTRDIEIWKPNRLLCKRFNVPEPEISEADLILQRKRKSKFSVFDYYEAYQQNKTVKEGPETKAPDEVKTVQQENTTAVSTISQTEISNKEIAESTTDLPDLVVKNYCNKSEDLENLQQKNATNYIPIDSYISKSTAIVLKEDTVTSLPTTSRSIVQNSEYAKKSFSSTSNVTKSANKYLVANTDTTQLPKVPKVTVPMDPKKKKDLFKAIFLSSSESEEDEELDNSSKQSNKIEEIKKTLIEDITSKPADKVIPKPIKGIFADLDWSKINKPKTANISSKQDKHDLKTEHSEVQNSKQLSEDIYGPKLPAQSSSTENIWKPTFKKVDSQTVRDSSSSEVEWMEIGSTTTEKSNSKTKKHKKHKSKHKKHKSKSKKKKR